MRSAGTRKTVSIHPRMSSLEWQDWPVDSGNIPPTHEMRSKNTYIALNEIEIWSDQTWKKRGNKPTKSEKKTTERFQLNRHRKRGKDQKGSRFKNLKRVQGQEIGRQAKISIIETNHRPTENVDGYRITIQRAPRDASVGNRPWNQAVPFKCTTKPVTLALG